MKGLSETVASAPLSTSDELMIDDNGDNYQFFSSCVEEIDRYRRLDEWIPSYHNVLSVTALECKNILSKSASEDQNPLEFLQYTREGGYDELRVSAFKNLVELGFAKDDRILKWLLHVLGYDPSPYLRRNLLQLFGQLLGSIAIGEEENTKDTAEALQQAGGLVIEQEASTESRQADLARKQTVPGALAALKEAIDSNEVLKKGVWDAIMSPVATLYEIGDLLMMCELVYEVETSMIVTLRYPKYWRVHKIGARPSANPKGKPSYLLRFTQDGRPRTKKFVKAQLPKITFVQKQPQLAKQSSTPASPQLVIKLPTGKSKIPQEKVRPLSGQLKAAANKAPPAKKPASKAPSEERPIMPKIKFNVKPPKPSPGP